METAVGIIIAVLGILAAYFYARLTRFESAQAAEAREQDSAKIAAQEAAARKKRAEEEAKDEKEKSAILASGDGAAAGRWLSDSFRPSGGAPAPVPATPVAGKPDPGV